MVKLTALLALLVVLLINGCRYFYHVDTNMRPRPEDIRWEDFNEKYLILHKGFDAWHMTLKSVDSSLLTCELEPLPKEHRMYQNTTPNKDNRFLKTKENDQSSVLNEVHIYTSAIDMKTGEGTRIRMSDIIRMEVYQYSKTRSVMSFVIPVVIAIPATVGLIGLIILLTKSSCPYVYTWSGNGFDFAGEIFSGAVYASLERDDWLPLPGLAPYQGHYRIMIANRLPEIQHVNLAELRVVDHPQNIHVLTDKNGVIHTWQDPLATISATTAGNRMTDTLINLADGKCFTFSESPAETGDTCARNSVTLTFQVPGGAKKAKLIIRAKNSIWGDYVFGEFSKKFGSKYERWVKKQGKGDPSQPLRWQQEQALPLMVSVQHGHEWLPVDYFNLAGPLGFRDMIMPLEIPDSDPGGPDHERILMVRLETGFMFWELDYAAVDFSEDQPVKSRIVSVASATDQDGRHIEKALVSADNSYLIQPMKGNEVIIDFPVPENDPSITRTLFLHSRGYYLHVRDYDTPPDIAALKTFRTPGRLSQFSYGVFTETYDRFARRYPDAIPGK